MAGSRGKRIALVVGTVVLLALVVAGFAAKEPLRAQWYIWRLSSEDAQVRHRAADALVAIKSIRGAREMVRLLKEKRFPAITGVVARSQSDVFLVDPLAYGLFNLRPMALEIVRAEADGMEQARGIITMLEGRWGETPVEVVFNGLPNWRDWYMLQ